MDQQLFPIDLPEREWVEFDADGFKTPVAGIIHRGANPPSCGMPLGGIDTGCLDLDVAGVLGYCSIFNSLVPRRGSLNVPFLGISLGHRTWVLTTSNMNRYDGTIWTDTYGKRTYRGVRVASDIHYWGHYPVVDMEYVTDAPVSVGLRAWSPFLPGDVGASNTPGAVFEVRIRNTSEEAQDGALAFSFPGPSEGEADTTAFNRREVEGDGFHGLSVESKQASYALGVIGEDEVRLGGELGMDETAWATIEHELPYASSQAGTTAAVSFSLAPGEEKVVRFVLAWYSPVWMGGGTMTAGGNAYTHMYASRYEDAVAVARYLARDHESLLGRILAWQQVIHSDQTVPPWLSDTLVNILHLITETSVWAQAKSPVGDWCKPEDGVFGMCECPRACPQIECIPCSFYGNVPLVYFYPELALSTLRSYKSYQYPNGAAPWVFGGCTVGSKPYEVALPSPGYSNKPQTTLDGPCYVDMVDRMWMRTGDNELLREFYDSVKKNTIFTMNLRPGSGAAGIVSMPTDNLAQDWFEDADLFGIVPHIGGAHLAQLRMAVRMAKAMGDSEFVRQCEEWIEQGSAVMEEHAWAGTHYMLFNELETGKQSDVVMGYQLDGEWMALSHGLEGVFRHDRVEVTLETIKSTAAAMSEHGAVAFSKPGAEALGKTDWDPGYWGARGIHGPGAFMLAMTYMYGGQRDFGLDLTRRTVHEVVQRGLYWNWPVVIDPAPGGWDASPEKNPTLEPKTVAGMDYYQNMMLWSLPAAMEGQDLSGPCAPGGLVDRVLKAAAK
jgi:uncharacterized protein (DUF608 family)